jgi:asparagine synthetase B (glutamine-hydrolysing)
MSVQIFSRQLLEIDAAATAEHIEASIRRTVGQLRRRGVVVALSGGIDSAVVGALAARALGPNRVVALLMPESAPGPGTRDGVQHQDDRRRHHGHVDSCGLLRTTGRRDSIGYS